MQKYLVRRCKETTEMAWDEEGKIEKATLEGDKVGDIERTASVGQGVTW